MLASESKPRIYTSQDSVPERLNLSIRWAYTLLRILIIIVLDAINFHSKTLKGKIIHNLSNFNNWLYRFLRKIDNNIPNPQSIEEVKKIYEK